MHAPAATLRPYGVSAPRRGSPSAAEALPAIGVMIAMTWAVLAAGWVNGAGGTVVVAITSVIEVALLARAAAPRIAAVLAAPLLGLAAIVPATLASMPVDAVPSAGATASHYGRALVTGLASTQDWDFTVGLCAVIFVCAYWLGWVALREHRGVLAVVPVYAVLATNVLNAHHPEAVALPEAITLCLSLAVIAAAHMAGLRDRWAAARISPLRGLRGRFGTSVAGVAVVLTLVAVLMPPLTTADVSATLFPGLVGGKHAGSGHTTRHGPGTATIGFNSAVQPGGALVSKPHSVLTYSTDSTAPLYIRVVDDTVFSAGAWYPETGDNSVADGGFSFISFHYDGGTLPRDTTPAGGGVGKAEQVVHATFHMQPGATGDEPLAPFTGEPVAASLPGVAAGLVDVAASSGSVETGLVTVDGVQLDQQVTPGQLLRTTALVPTASVAQLRAAGTAYPAFVAEFTQLADDFTGGLKAIDSLAAQWTAGITDPYDRAAAIEQHLRDPALFHYTLTPPAAPTGEWPVTYFLTTSHRGYCQYYASAMGAMLRSLGIPARLVSGYGPGALPGETPRTQAELTVSSSDAHTWVEAYFPGYGWIPFEPTPPSADGNYLPFARGPGGTTSGGAGPTPSTSPRASLKPGFAGGSAGGTGSKPAARAGGVSPLVVVLAIFAAALALAVVVLMWLLLPRSLAGAWRRVEAVGAVLGVERRRAETHRAYAARLAGARPRAAPMVGELAEVASRAEFSRDGVQAVERAQALRTWRRAVRSFSSLGRSPG